MTCESDTSYPGIKLPTTVELFKTGSIQAPRLNDGSEPIVRSGSIIPIHIPKSPLIPVTHQLEEILV